MRTRKEPGSRLESANRASVRWQIGMALNIETLSRHGPGRKFFPARPNVGQLAQLGAS